MDTAILYAAYEAIRFKSLTEQRTCSVCYRPSTLLMPPGEYVETYLRQCGWVGEIRLCDQCLKDMSNWDMDSWGKP